MAPPKPATRAPLTPPNSKHALDAYIAFLASYHREGQYPGPTADIADNCRVEELFDYELSSLAMPDNAAIVDAKNPASPLHYSAAETALLLLDFQGLTIDLCGQAASNAVAKAREVKDWALRRKVMIVHSVVDVIATPPVTCKGAERIAEILASVEHNRGAAEEPTSIAFAQEDREYITIKPPGVISGLKSHGAMDLLVEHGIKSLIICGLSTSGCVLRTSIPATDDGFIVSIISDACADPREGLHEVLMERVLPSRAHVFTAEEFIEEWEKAADS